MSLRWLQQLLDRLLTASEIEFSFHAVFPDPEAEPEPGPPVVPRSPRITSVTLEGMEGSMAHYSVQASPADASVTRRELSVALNGNPPTMSPLDAGFDAVDGDAYVLTLTDFATDVASDPSDPFSGTASGGGPPPPPPPGKPAKPTILGVTLDTATAPPPPTPPAPPVV